MYDVKLISDDYVVLKYVKEIIISCDYDPRNCISQKDLKKPLW